MAEVKLISPSASGLIDTDTGDRIDLSALRGCQIAWAKCIGQRICFKLSRRPELGVLSLSPSEYEHIIQRLVGGCPQRQPIKRRPDRSHSYGEQCRAE